MSDGLGYTAGNGATIATDDLGGIHYQRVKVCYGSDGFGIDVSGAAPLPVLLYNSSVPVTGTVSVDSLPAISGTVSVSNFPATQAVTQSGTWNVGVTGSVAVTGTFWQATQPVSGPLTDTQLRASAVPVSGTFWQSTQPVSIAATVATRDLKDSARTQFSAATVIGGVTCVTTEAMLTMTPVRAGVAGTAGTSIQATSGKTLRLTAIVFSTRSSSAAVLSGRCALRMNPSGAAIATSPILAIASTTQQAAALAEAGDTCVIPLPDGIEISGTQQVGLSQVCSATTGVVYATLIGFEY